MFISCPVETQFETRERLTSTWSTERVRLQQLILVAISLGSYSISELPQQRRVNEMPVGSMIYFPIEDCSALFPSLGLLIDLRGANNDVNNSRKTVDVARRREFDAITV
jgi:hypothetical protein